MRQELDQKLCERFPLIMAERELPMTQTCMCWGFECGDGWYNIIAEAMHLIQSHIDFTNRRREILLQENKYNQEIPAQVSQVVFTQVKEKFGQLRIYFDGGDEYTHGVIRMAEAMSAHTCELCGAPGETNGQGWVRTLCELHRAQN